VRGEACRDAPCADGLLTFLIRFPLIQVDEVDGKAHEKGVHGFAGLITKPSPGNRLSRPSRPLLRVLPLLANHEMRSQRGAAREVYNCRGTSGLSRLAWNKKFAQPFGKPTNVISSACLRLRACSRRKTSLRGRHRHGAAAGIGG